MDSIQREQMRQFERKKNKRKLKVFDGKPSKAELDKLWAEIIKKRAGYKSELSGKGKKEGIEIAAHHIYGKSNLRLRYDLQNGICLENYKEHLWGVHNKNNPQLANKTFNRIAEYIGQKRLNYLDSLCNKTIKQDLNIIKIYLQSELKKL